MYSSSATTKDDTVRNLKSTAANLKNEAMGAINEAQDDLRTTANRAGRRVRAFLQNAGGDISHASETVTTQIRQRPVQSSLMALGLGVVIGALLRR